MKPQLLVFTDDPGWHGVELERAFAARGWGTRFGSLRDCRFRLDGSGAGLELPVFGDDLPDAVFVRGIAGGSLEEVVLRLDVLHALDALGVAVYNDGRSIERTVDKAMTSFLLQRAGIDTPATWVVNDSQQAHQVVMREHLRGHTLVCKPLFGSQGRGLLRLCPGDPLPEPESVRGVYYLQRMLETGAGWYDWRVLVIGGRAVAAMRREANDWVTNVAKGASCHPESLTLELASLAERAVRAVGAQYGGVDLMRDRSGRLWVLEVNGVPAWRGLQQVSELDLAGALADGLLARTAGTAVPAAVAT